MEERLDKLERFVDEQQKVIVELQIRQAQTDGTVDVVRKIGYAIAGLIIAAIMGLILK